MPSGPSKAPTTDPALGVVSTLDVCSLIPVHGLTLPSTDRGDQVTELQGQTFSACNVSVQPKGGALTETQVNVDATNSLAVIKKQFPGASIEPAGQLLEVTPKGQPEGGFCSLGVLTKADTYISASTSQGPDTGALCPLDKAIVRDIATTIDTGRLQHFAPWPANSTGGLRACALVTMTEAVKALPAVNSTFEVPDEHSCIYDESNGPTSVYFATELVAKPDTLASLQAQWRAEGKRYPGQSVEIAGRKTLLGPLFGTNHSCEAETDGRVWPHGFGNDSSSATLGQSAAFTEVPTITLSDAALSVSTLCKGATLLAQDVWPQLPR